MSPRIAIVAAMERELRPLLANDEYGFVRQEATDLTADDTFLSPHAAIIFSGIGAAAAARAAERVIAAHRPRLLVSAGVAGAVGTHAVGSVLLPGTVQDESGASFATSSRQPTTLLTVTQVAGSMEKQRWQGQGIDIVDMEAAAVAAAAGRAGVPFLAVKAVSDAVGDRIPPMSRFIRDGVFHPAPFLAWAALRPWWWGRIRSLGRNTAFASRRLCLALGTMLTTEDWTPTSPDDMQRIAGYF